MFIGIKFVDAEPMDSANALEKGYRTGTTEGDEIIAGYEVTYEDGCKSWCPKDVFEKNNVEVKSQELADTCKMMVSVDYKERFKAEYIQLKNRYNGLKNMVDKWDKGELPFESTCPRQIYNCQLDGMKKYLDCLVVRCGLEGICED